MSKESLSIMIVKTLLAIIIFAGVGTIIVGGGLLIGKQGEISNTKPTEPSTREVIIEGNFVKNLGHPFSGPAILTSDGYYGISGSKLQEIITLSDGTRIKVIGIIFEQKRTIPEAGKFNAITQKTINITSFEIIK